MEAVKDLRNYFKGNTGNSKTDIVCKWIKCFPSWVGDCGKGNRKKCQVLKTVE